LLRNTLSKGRIIASRFYLRTKDFSFNKPLSPKHPAFYRVFMHKGLELKDKHYHYRTNFYFFKRFIVTVQSIEEWFNDAASATSFTGAISTSTKLRV
jgi:hypothetical protein